MFMMIVKSFSRFSWSVEVIGLIFIYNFVKSLSRFLCGVKVTSVLWLAGGGSP